MSNIEKLLQWQRDNIAMRRRNQLKGAAKRRRWIKNNIEKVRATAAYARSKIKSVNHNPTWLWNEESQKKAAENRSWYRPTAAHRKKIRLALTGTKGTGKIVEGPDNHLAKIWEFRDPQGVTHRFVNLHWWVKQNIHLFSYLDNPGFKSTFLHRVRSGLSGLVAKRTRACGSWYGWTVVSVVEKQNDRNDLLDRHLQSVENAENIVANRAP